MRPDQVQSLDPLLSLKKDSKIAQIKDILSNNWQEKGQKFGHDQLPGSLHDSNSCICVKISNNLLKHNYTNIVKYLFYMKFYQKAWNFEKNLYPVMEFEGDFESLGTNFLPNWKERGTSEFCKGQKGIFGVWAVP